MFKINLNPRRLSVIAFSLLFAYILSFVFEGQVLYSLTDYFNISSTAFIFPAIIGHFAGLFSCGFFTKTTKRAKYTMLSAAGVSFVGTIPFFFDFSPVVWTSALMLCAFASGCGVAAWGSFLKSCTPKNERIKTCADVLIYSNILMILINLTAIYISPMVGVVLSLLTIALAGILSWFLPVPEIQPGKESREIASLSLKMPMLLLMLFVIILTINSGLMYQVFNPAFEHLTWLTSWYWAVPYIIALAVMRNLPVKAKRPYFLYIGMVMIMLSFVFFMLLDRSAVSYFIVDTLMLGACGIFDLFWWSIIGEMLEYSHSPVKIFGIGLSSNVLGVLLGGLIGSIITSAGLDNANVAVIALSVVCVTLVILPPLNRQLLMVLKSHAYLIAYSALAEKQQSQIVKTAQGLDMLTEREKDVLQLVLEGSSNKNIAAKLFISENTVKTHLKNIYMKYDVTSRAELISIVLKNKTQA